MHFDQNINKHTVHTISTVAAATGAWFKRVAAPIVLGSVLSATSNKLITPSPMPFKSPLSFVYCYYNDTVCHTELDYSNSQIA